MAKPLMVELNGKPLNLALEKVERSKLYGYVETEVVDEAGKRCELATLTGDGHSIVGKGGTALAYLSTNGLWRDKAELKAVDVHGQVITPVKSTFDAPVTLDKKGTIEDLLAHNVHLVYRLTPDGDDATLRKELEGGTIFQFPFSYRGGLDASAGFLLLGADGNIFLCVGVPTKLEFVGMKATAAVVPDAQAAPAEEDDLLDFSVV
jgi:hypothetical protein